MSKFNVKEKVRPIRRPDATNKHGADAYATPEKLDLASRMLTSFLNGKYYENEKLETSKIIELLKKIRDKKFSAKAGIFARNEFGMRSVTHVLFPELAREMSRLRKDGYEGDDWVRRAITRAVRRPDDIVEMLGYWDTLGEKARPAAFKRGLRDAFDKFDDYQLRKWSSQNSSKTSWKLVDAIRILRPIPTDRNRKALDELTSPSKVVINTRQAKMVKAGKDAVASVGKNASAKVVEKAKKEAKANVWEEILSNPSKAPIEDTLNNLRGVMEDAPHMIDAAIEVITNRDAIRKSLIFPFKYINAELAIKARTTASPIQRKVIAALSDGLDIASENIPELKNTLVVVDVSDSMKRPVSISPEQMKRYERFGTQPMSRKQAASVMGAMLAKAGYADIMIFASGAKYISYNPRDSVSTICQNIHSNVGCYGHGTNFNAIFDNAKRKFDRIVIFSDMQGWMGRDQWNNQMSFHDPLFRREIGAPQTSFADYCRQYGKPWIYSVDLGGYGTLMFPSDGSKVVSLAGYSEKIFDLMEGAEKDPNVLINEIEKIEF